MGQCGGLRPHRKGNFSPFWGYKKAHARCKSGMGGCWAVVGVAEGKEVAGAQRPLFLAYGTRHALEVCFYDVVE